MTNFHIKLECLSLASFSSLGYQTVELSTRICKSRTKKIWYYWPLIVEKRSMYLYVTKLIAIIGMSGKEATVNRALDGRTYPS